MLEKCCGFSCKKIAAQGLECRVFAAEYGVERMPDHAEYNRLTEEIGRIRDRYSACEQRIENNRELIRQLKAQKTAVSDLKDLYKTHRKITKELHEEERKWKGFNNDFYNFKMDSVELEDETYYNNSLDYVLDSINNEITRLENLILEEFGLLGDLGASINTLATKIENFFN